jgi:hypothetical protein
MLSKTEIVWRQLLVEALEHDNRRSSVTELSRRFGFGPSTVHRSLVAPREMGAVDGGWRGLIVYDPIRLLLHWAGQRRLRRDKPLTVHTGLPAEEIEAILPDSTILTGAAGYARRFSNTVADYSTVYVYSSDPDGVLAAVPDLVGAPDLIILEPDEFLPSNGRVVSVPQMYVDLFATPGWQAQRFLHAMNERLEVASAI